MLPKPDHTHNPHLRSWVPDANGHSDFPIQNLPFGIFEPPDEDPRGGVAIGDHILDLYTLSVSGLLSETAQQSCATATDDQLNSFFEEGPEARLLLRQEISALLAEGSPQRPELLHRAAGCTLHLPARVPDYTDFYAGIHHATNVGRLFRPDAPLLPNYKYVPIGYHGRASSLRPSGMPVRRPSGQRKRAEDPEPTYGPARNLDFELELGIWCGPGNPLGEPIPIAEAHRHIAGYSLLNDWSARDLQAWEYQPLGPFLAKSFQTSVSPWIVTPEALAPFRSAQPRRPAGDPAPLPYLFDEADQQSGALALELEVLLLTPAMRVANEPPHRLCRTHAEQLYWTPQQLVAHHTSNGCNLQPGDLLGTGTISSATPEGYGSLLEQTHSGREPILLPNGEQRRFLEDGDEVILRAHAHRAGYASIGFGDCRGTITPAL